MLRTLASAALAVAAAAASAGGRTDQNSAILDSARRVALSYARNLPNFVCTQEVRRLGDWHSAGTWVPLDTVRASVTYHNQKETYQVVARNNRPSRQELDQLAGTFSRGEFGSVLRLIFEPASKTEFQWRDWDLQGLRPLAVFGYRVAAANSLYLLRAYTQELVVGFHGEVAIDPETGRAMRWTVIAEISSRFPIAESATTMEYGLRDIGGTEYLLPVRAEVLAAERGANPGDVEFLSPAKREAALHPMRYRNVIEFRDYRKFTADSRITF